MSEIAEHKEPSVTLSAKALGAIIAAVVMGLSGLGVSVANYSKTSEARAAGQSVTIEQLHQTFVPRAEFEARFEEREKRLARIEQQLNRIEDRQERILELYSQHAPLPPRR